MKAKKPRRFELGISEFVGSDMFEDENQDPTTGKLRRVSLSLQKRHDSDSVKPRKALQASIEIGVGVRAYGRFFCSL